MKDKITAQVGQVIEVNGKQYRATESGFELITVKRGPLGGVLKRLADLKDGEHFVVRGYVWDHNRCDPDEFKTKVVIGSDDFMSFYDDLPQNVEVETSIPARPTFTPMTAGEAADLPDIVGRWVAVRVSSASDPKEDSCALRVEGDKDVTFFDNSDPILLIEGADLP